MMFFFFFSMLGNMAFFFFSTVWTLCLQMFIEVDKGEVSTVKRCYTWASPAMEAVTPGAGGAYWKVWPWWGAAAQPLEAGEGWMDVVFFLPEGGRGWRKNPVADVENAIIFFVEMKKGRFEWWSFFFWLVWWSKFFVGVQGWIKVERQNSFSGNHRKRPCSLGRRKPVTGLKCSEHG